MHMANIRMCLFCVTSECVFIIFVITCNSVFVGFYDCVSSKPDLFFASVVVRLDYSMDDEFGTHDFKKRKWCFV